MIRFFRTTPFFLPTICLILGIFLAECTSVSWFVIPFLFVGIFVFFFLRKKIFKNECLFPLKKEVFILFVFTLIGFSLVRIKQELPKRLVYEEKKIFVAEVVSSPKKTAKSVSVVVAIEKMKEDSVWIEIPEVKINLYLLDSIETEKVKVGDKIIFKEKISLPKKNEKIYGFDYAQYLHFQSVFGIAFLRENAYEIIPQKPSFSLETYASKVRQQLQFKYQKIGLSGDVLHLAEALTLGYKDDLSEEIRTTFSVSGAMHVLAVSGLHVGIIFSILSFVFSILFLKKRNRFVRIVQTILIFIALWAYAVLTGLSPSVTRACFMCSVLLFCRLMNLQSNTMNALFFAAFFLLLKDPYSLFSVGFQLSFLAVLGILIIHPLLQRVFYSDNRLVKYVIDILTVSLAAQIATLPISIYYFLQMPTYGLLSNLIVIPLAPIIICLCVFALIISFSSFSTLYLLLGKIISFLLEFCVRSLSFIENLPNSSLKIGFHLEEVVFLFLMISCVLWFCYSKSKLSVFASLFSILIFVNFNTFHFCKNKQKQQELILYADKGNFSYSMKQNDFLYVFSKNYQQLHRSASNHWILQGDYYSVVEKPFKNQFVYDGKRFLILDSFYDLRNKFVEKPLMVDYLIIDKGAKVYLNKLRFQIKAKNLISTKDVSYYFDQKLKSWAEKNDVDFYSIRQENEFIMN